MSRFAENSRQRDAYTVPFDFHPNRYHRRTRGLFLTPGELIIVMENRFRVDRRLGTVVGTVDLLIEAIQLRDRWQIARNTTGTLLEELLAGDDDHRFFSSDEISHRGLQGAPISVADDRTAIVVGTVPTGSGHSSVPITAVLIAGSVQPRRWLVAALDFKMTVDTDFQRRVQFGAFSEDEDLAVIAAHEPLDAEAAAIDWGDPTAILRDNETGTVTVADAVAELLKWDRSAWPWLAADRIMFSSLYLRAKHPELVRGKPPHEEENSEIFS